LDQRASGLRWKVNCPVPLVLPAGGHPGQHLAVRPLGQQPLVKVSEDLQLRQSHQLERAQARRFILEMTDDGLFGGEWGAGRHIGSLDAGTAQQGAPSFHGESFKMCEAGRKLGENASPADGKS